jgi:hypothetical protein
LVFLKTKKTLNIYFQVSEFVQCQQM